MGEFQSMVPNIKNHIHLSVRTGEQGIQAWRSKVELDAWITYKSWNNVLRCETEFIPLPAEMAVSRPTLIAVTAWTKKRKLARNLVLFLQSEPAHVIFRKWGWNGI